MTDYQIPQGYTVVDARNLASILSRVTGAPPRLGGAPDAWTVTEIGDGNMNAVFRVAGPSGSVVAKQALPYIRAIGPSWPFPVSRADFEARAARIHGRAAPGHVVEILEIVDHLGLIVMEDLRDFTVLRHALTRGDRFSTLSRDLGAYLALSLLGTSDLVLSTTRKNALAEDFLGNTVLCETTQDVVFTGPYTDAPLNRVTPGQEALAAELRGDAALGAAATAMKYRFRTRAEALVHGDLHTGSVMVREGQTRIIDAEWAFMGPMGFDIGALLGNLLLAHFAQPGHGPDRDDHAEWILRVFEETWAEFVARARDTVLSGPGGLVVPGMVRGTEARVFDGWLADLWSDTLGFAGCKMIRRIIGISHVEDFEWIADVALRARCEARALRLARSLLLDRGTFPDPGSVTRACRLSRA